MTTLTQSPIGNYSTIDPQYVSIHIDTDSSDQVRLKITAIGEDAMTQHAANSPHSTILVGEQPPKARPSAMKKGKTTAQQDAISPITPTNARRVTFAKTNEFFPPSSFTSESVSHSVDMENEHTATMSTKTEAKPKTAVNNNDPSNSDRVNSANQQHHLPSVAREVRVSKNYTFASILIIIAIGIFTLMGFKKL